MYSQTTEEQKYLSKIYTLISTTLRDRIAQYKLNRSTVLGLPDLRGSQPNLKIRQKLAAIGTELGKMLAANKRDKDFLENEVNLAITDLGGVDKISKSSEWSWVLDDITTDGVFKLPGLPFEMQVRNPSGGPGIRVSVDIKLNEDGSGTPIFLNEQEDSMDPV